MIDYKNSKQKAKETIETLEDENIFFMPNEIKQMLNALVKRL